MRTRDDPEISRLMQRSPRLDSLPYSECSCFEARRKDRTPHACNFCRKGRYKCTGVSPCERCKDTDLDCVYGDRKRDRDRSDSQNHRTGTLFKLRSRYVEKLRRKNYALSQNNHMCPETLKTLSEDPALPELDPSAVIELLKKVRVEMHEICPVT